MTWLALDIGGANLKVADGEGYAASREYPLWERPADLPSELRSVLLTAPEATQVAVTMTGELADCFATKAEGVEAILEAVEHAAEGRQVVVYRRHGDLVTPRAALADAILAAASNWHVLASFGVRYCGHGAGLLIDIGSTTTDIIPLGAEGPRAVGRTDPQRLATGELVYTGIERSPVCAIVYDLPWRGEACAVAQELFATAADAYLVLGDLAEDPTSTNTADGRPRQKEFAQARLARMICADSTMYSWDDALRAAVAVREAQLALLQSAARRVIARMESPPATIVLSGHGEFLGRLLLERLEFTGRTVSLSEQLGPLVSRCATAHALAVIARERLGA
jgi:hypothetical protein